MARPASLVGACGAIVVALTCEGTAQVVSSPIPPLEPPAFPVLVSAAMTGAPGNATSDFPVVDASGSCVAFQSAASDLVAGDTNGVTDVFVRHLGTRATSRVSVASDGLQGNALSLGPSVSGDCRYVTFTSYASNLVPDDTNGVADVFVHDLATGQTSRVRLPGGAQATRDCSSARISQDGAYVAFDTAGNPLLSGTGVFVYERSTGQTTAVPRPAHIDTRQPAISADGRYVAFMSYSRGSVPGVLYDDRAWWYDRTTGETREIAVVGDPNDAFDVAGPPSISDDGRMVTYARSRPCSSGLRWWTVFAWDREILVAQPIAPGGADSPEGNPVCLVGMSGSTWRQALAGGGRFVGLSAVAQSPANGFDTFVVDRFAGVGTSVASTPRGVSGSLSLTADGRLVTFVARTRDVLSVDTGEQGDVFLLSLDSDNDRMPDAWESAFGLASHDPRDGSTDLDEDGRPNVEEYQEATHPRGFFSHYLAEGATSAFFATRLSMANPNAVPARTMTHFLRADGRRVHQQWSIDAGLQRHVDPASLAGMASAEFATLVESDVPLVVDRTMTWDVGAYGGHAETAVPSPATTWYLAEGATHSGFDSFYLLQNPTELPAEIEVSYLLPAPRPEIVKRYRVEAASRLTLWVDLEDPRLASIDVAAVVQSTNDIPIVVERAMYLSTREQPFIAGHGGTAIAAPSTRWFLGEGATGPFFDTFVVVANPSPATARLQVAYLLPGGETLDRIHEVAPRSRHTIWVDAEDARLEDTAVSTIVTSVNAVPVVVERVMWWPGPGPATWYEAHVAAGAIRPARRWALVDSPSVAPGTEDTFLLIANTSPVTGSFTLQFTTDAAVVVRDARTIPANSRVNVWVNLEFPALAGQRFWTLVESAGPSPVELVVEHARYWTEGGKFWSGGTCARAVPLPEVFSDEATFHADTAPTDVASFDGVGPGAHPSPLALGSVVVTLTADATALVEPAGAHGLGFDLPFLTAGVADNANAVVITFPEGTVAAGLQLAAPSPDGVTLTVVDHDGGLVVPFKGSTAGFIGFRSASAIQTIRISAPTRALSTAFAHLGRVVFTRGSTHIAPHL